MGTNKKTVVIVGGGGANEFAANTFQLLMR
jgi:hypothetical protein